MRSIDQQAPETICCIGASSVTNGNLRISSKAPVMSALHLFKKLLTSIYGQYAATCQHFLGLITPPNHDSIAWSMLVLTDCSTGNSDIKL